MIDVLDAVYWDEMPVEMPAARRRWNPLGRRGLGRREQERAAAKATGAPEEDAVREGPAGVELARRAGLLVGLGSRRGKAAEERGHVAETSIGTRRAEMETERAALVRRVQQAAAVVAAFERGAQGDATFGVAGRFAAVGSGWSGAGDAGMSGFGEGLVRPGTAGLGLEEVDRGFERDARRGY